MGQGAFARGTRQLALLAHIVDWDLVRGITDRFTSVICVQYQPSGTTSASAGCARTRVTISGALLANALLLVVYLFVFLAHGRASMCHRVVLHVTETGRAVISHFGAGIACGIALSAVVVAIWHTHACGTTLQTGVLVEVREHPALVTGGARGDSIGTGLAIVHTLGTDIVGGVLGVAGWTFARAGLVEQIQ